MFKSLHNYHVFIPLYLNFSLAGFGHVIAFISIEQKDILEIENYTRKNRLSSFSFRPGDIKLIEALVAHVKKVTDTNGFAHFTCDSNIEKKMSKLNIDEQKNETVVSETQAQYLLLSLIHI